MKMSPECPADVKSSGQYFCQILDSKRSGTEEEICSICPELADGMRKSALLNEAFSYAAAAHRGQTRKGTEIPYLIHLVRTWNCVRRMTEDIEEQAAALLHDVLEDTPVAYEELCADFGMRIAGLVMGESEWKRRGRPAGETWQVRKQETIDRLRGRLGYEEERAAMHIALGDKLANLYSMAYEYGHVGDRLWEKFNQKDKAMHGWYYGEMGIVFADYFKGREEYAMIRQYQHYYQEVFGEYETSGDR